MNTKLHRNIASRVVTSLLLFKSHQESWDEIYSVVTTHSYLGNVTASPGVLVHVDAVQRDEKNIDDDVNPKGEVWEILRRRSWIGSRSRVHSGVLFFERSP